MRSILLLVAHPNIKKSRANRVIVDRLRSLAHVQVHELYETYPEFHINVAQEKKLLESADILCIQQPFYWYSMPPLLKLWHDLTLEYGFAYGPGGNALKGKSYQLSLTIGGPREVYQPEGRNRYFIEQFFPPYEQTAHLCQMPWLEPLCLFGAHQVSDDQLEAHAERVRERLVEIANPQFVLETR